jgi:multidrug efflux pump subunit AcrA (membrane-fusion protein)
MLGGGQIKMRKSTASFFMTAITALTVAALWTWPVERWETVKTVRVTQGNVQTTVSVTGAVARRGEYYSAHPQGGVVAQVYVKEGQAVTAGQPIFRLEDTRLQAQLQGAMQALEKAESAQNAFMEKVTEAFGPSRAEALAAQSLPSNDSAQAELTAQIQALTYEIEGLTMRAYKDGQVLQVLAREGELLLPGSPGAVLSQAESEVRAQVSSRDAQQIKEGMRARISQNSIPLGDAVVEKVGVLKPNAQGVPYAQVVLAPADGLSVSLGAQVDVDVVLAERTNVPVLPVEAITDSGSLYQVYDGRAWQLNAQIALSNDTWAAVNSLPLGAEVVLSPGDGLKDGTRLKVTKP